MHKVLYPSWRYHATDGKRLIRSEAEAAELGPGWFDFPQSAPTVAPPVLSADPDVDTELEALYEAEPAPKKGKKGTK